MPARRFALLVVTALSWAATGAHAHEVRPGYLQVQESGEDKFDVTWKVPANGEYRLSLYARLPKECTGAPDQGSFAGGAFIERWQAKCPGGLVGRTISIEGLSATRTDVLARVASLKLGERLLFVRKLRRLDTGESRGAVLREVGGQLYLTGEREHVGCDTERLDHASLEFLGGRVGGCLVELLAEVHEHRHEHLDSHFMDGQRHYFFSWTLVLPLWPAARLASIHFLVIVHVVSFSRESPSGGASRYSG